MYSEKTQPVGTMAIDSLQKDRTLYRYLLEKELENGNALLHGQRENGENKVKNKDVSKCICGLDALQQKLENTGERLSILIEGQEQEGEVLEKIQNDGDLITVVMDYRDELVNLKICLQEQEASRDNNSPISSLDQTVVQLTAKVHQILNGQQQLQQQQLTNMQSNDIDVAVRCSNEIHVGGKLSLGGGPGLAWEPSSQQGQILEWDQDLGIGRDHTLGRGQNFGADQGLGGGPRMENDHCRRKNPTLKCDLCPGKDPYLGKDSIPRRGQRLGKHQSKKRPNAIKTLKPRKRQKRWRYQRLTRNRNRKMHKVGKIPNLLKRHKAMMRYKSKRRPTVKWKFLSRRCHRLQMDLCASGGVKKWIKTRINQHFKKDQCIRVLSLGRGPVLRKRPDKPRLQSGFILIDDVFSKRSTQQHVKVLLPNRKIVHRPINLLFPIECPVANAVEFIQNSCD